MQNQKQQDDDMVSAVDTSSEQYRFECEAREWVRRVKQNGMHWWQDKKRKLIKLRGQESVNILIEEMTKQREKMKK